MQSNKYFGQYYPIDSKIHNLNVFTKLITLLLLIITLIISNSLRLELVIFFFIFILLYESKVPLRFYFNIIYGLRYLLIILVVLLASKGLTLNVAVTILFKVFNIISYLSLIFYTTSNSELKYGLEKLISPFNFLNLRISTFINRLVNLINFFPLLLITEREVLISSSARGLDYFHTDLMSRFITALISLKNTFRLTMEKLKRKKLSNKIKLYSTKTYRTNLRTNKFKLYDLIILMVFIMFIYYSIRMGI